MDTELPWYSGDWDSVLTSQTSSVTLGKLICCSFPLNHVLYIFTSQSFRKVFESIDYRVLKFMYPYSFENVSLCDFLL